jgi:hypothetical protein
MALALTAGSCLCLLISLIFWARGQSTHDQISLSNQIHTYSLASMEAGLYATHAHTTQLIPNPSTGPNQPRFSQVPLSSATSWTCQITSRPNPGLSYRRWGYFSAGAGRWNALTITKTFAIPTYALLIFFSLTTLLCFYLLKKTHIPKSHCQSCGYNLTGNPSTPTCPECGKATPQTST